jgi:hypothetical protein
MKHAVRIFSAFGALLLTASLVSATPNFSGTWVLDRAQSQLPQRPGGADQTPPDVKMVVEQSDAALTITRTMSRDSQERSHKEKFNLDGSEMKTTGPRGGEAVSRAHWDGDKLVISSTRAMKRGEQDVTIKGERIWSLSPDGRTLTVRSTFDTPRGQQTATAIYTKQ